MEEYAANFGKGIQSKDLVWFAKIEHERSHTHQERAVQLGALPKGTPKEGPQTHIHVIVSRMENLAVYQEKKEAGELALTAQGKARRAYKLSPLSHHQDTSKGPVKGGFGRNNFSAAVENQFDRKFGYQRPLTESFRYLHAIKYGSEQVKAEFQQLVQTATDLKPPTSVLSESKDLPYQPIQKNKKIAPGADNELGGILEKVVRLKETSELQKTLEKALTGLDEKKQEQAQEKTIQPIQKSPSKGIGR
jgi:hypothetical protein